MNCAANGIGDSGAIGVGDGIGNLSLLTGLILYLADNFIGNMGG